MCAWAQSLAEETEGPGLGSGLVPFLLRCVNLGKFLALLGICFLLCELRNLH